MPLTENSLFGRGRGSGDEFAAALAAGDFDGDGLDDLMIGMIGKRADNVAGAGRVAMIPSAVFASAPVVNARGFQLPRRADARRAACRKVRWIRRPMRGMASLCGILLCICIG